MTDTDWVESDSPITPPKAQSTVTPPTESGSSGSSGQIGDAPSTVEPTNNLLRIVLILGICIPAFIIVYLIFKPVKPSSSARNNPKRRQDDYEDFE